MPRACKSSSGAGMDMRPCLRNVPMAGLVGNMGAWRGAVIRQGPWRGLLEAGFGIAVAEVLRCQFL